MPAAKRPINKHQPRGLPIIHEDRDIIVVEKPCGLLTIGTDRDKSRTVHTILNEYVRKGDPRSRNRVYIVHRLDRETSGLLILAKSETAKKHLQEHWQDNDKRYLAVVHGKLAEQSGTISSYLAENSAFTVYSTDDPSLGKLSHTKYAVLKESRGLSMLEIQLLTGRKHQIRVHLSEKGHPVVGDVTYGGGAKKALSLPPADRKLATRLVTELGRQALHACDLEFRHPRTGEALFFRAPLPTDFARALSALGFSFRPART